MYLRFPLLVIIDHQVCERSVRKQNCAATFVNEPNSSCEVSFKKKILCCSSKKITIEHLLVRTNLGTTFTSKIFESGSKDLWFAHSFFVLNLSLLSQSVLRYRAQNPSRYYTSVLKYYLPLVCRLVCAFVCLPVASVNGLLNSASSKSYGLCFDRLD
jgi:hypothetical protein